MPKLMDVMEKLGLGEKRLKRNGESPFQDGADACEREKNTTKRSMQKSKLPPTIFTRAERQADEGCFKSVSALPDYQLEVTMETGSVIRFDFRSRLNGTRFGMLRDQDFFRSVWTDGNHIIFDKAGSMPVKITASEFMDLVLIDRRKQTW
jgi:two-component system chemotaxis response regulator CheY